MSIAQRIEALTADEFLLTDQHAFGPAWRYELVQGRIVAYEMQSPEHGAIGANLAGAVGSLLRAGSTGCRAEIGSGAVPKREQRNTARIPDVMIRCGEQPRVVFEVVSPSELRDVRARDQKRRDLQAVEGVQEIVEIYQDQMAAHVYRLTGDGAWLFQAIDGAEAALELHSVGLSIPLAALYENVSLPD